MKLEIAKVFRSIFDFKHRHIMIASGRTGGKSYLAAQLVTMLVLTHPQHDVVVCRDSYANIEKSVYNEIAAFIASNGLSSHFVFKKEPLRIISLKTEGIMYFEGIGGSDKSRTRSFKPLHPLIAVVYDELQQVREQESLEQANASFRRHLDVDKGLFVHLYNPPAQNSHWVNVYWNVKKRDSDWLCIHSDYRDIAKFLNDVDIKEILKMKTYDLERYEWMYLGKPGGGFGAVYPQFKRDKHFKPYKELLSKHTFLSVDTDEVNLCLRFGQRIQALIIGADSAVTHDATALVPLALMPNGQAVILDIFYHDPLLSGQRASAELLPYIQRWLDTLEKKYGLTSSFTTPIIFSVDSAATELTRLLRYHLSERYDVYAYGKQVVMDMVGVGQSALARNMIQIMDFGGYKNWLQERWIKDEHPLVVQLENLVWNEKQTGYDPLIPNDVSDAFTYAINQIYRNPNNLYPLVRYAAMQNEYYDTEGGQI